MFLALPFAASIFSLFLACASLLPKNLSSVRWWFFAGMTLLGVDSLCKGLSLRAAEPSDVLRWLTLGLITSSCVPAAWLGFSLIYSRGDFRDVPARRIIAPALAALLPILLSLGFQEQLLEEVPSAGPAGMALELHLGAIGKALNVAVILLLMWILMNLEQTFRSAVGTMRWRVKYVVLGLAVIFGARLYVRSQSLLFSGYDLNWASFESAALLIGCVFLILAHVRAGFVEIDVYPSRAVLQSSLTVLIVGGYLFVVGVLANLVRRFGGADTLQIQSLVVLLGLTGLTLLLLSDRLRQRVHGFLSRHFVKAQHDSVRIWTEFSARLANVKNEDSLCSASAKLISETFDILSVTVWLLDDNNERLIACSSTAGSDVPTVIPSGLPLTTSPFDLEAVDEPWAEQLRQHNPTRFANGGPRWCVPLRSGEQMLGLMVLGDRVNGVVYTFEQLQLMQCIADQVTSVLFNLRLANEVARARELEAFRTMSAFFVHDLKNTASSLNMMLKNLPVHFDNPAFREDTLRGIGNMAQRIDEIIGRLTAFRQQTHAKPVEADLNQLVTEAIDRLDQMPHVELRKELQPVPRMFADREQIQSVVTNLVLNARESLGTEGCIRVRTEHLGNSVVLSVSDNGCGMNEVFLNEHLFRPFRSTKKKGLGIGMFQSRMIVEAHGGSIKVESEAGRGSTFRVSLPVRSTAS